ncbi:helix-turn-helix transcriptional regulator [Jonesia quinghaiensis]|uniref:helix-turn-helix transcriptional regulator n=1 Tax=Jonesia quinghaiensis TaxID=262806 RepID=UPI00040B900C|nr:WYL domain-containing protein [Jonesia quinghaiensis]
MAERTPDRLARLLALVAHVSQSGPTPLSELARLYGTSSEQIRRDINLLWVTGTPGYLPQDLIDFDADALERGIVRVTQDRGLREPLRLGPQEGLSVLAALHALRGILAAGSAQSSVVAAVEQLEQKVALSLGPVARAIDIEVRPEVSPLTLQALQEAIVERRQVVLEYVDVADRVTVRTVEPAALFNDGESFYLDAWCLTSGSGRVFRVDRMAHVEVLASLATQVDYRPSLSAVPRGEGHSVDVLVTEQGRWLVEELPAREVVDVAQGVLVRLDVVNDHWLNRLLLQHGDVIQRVSPSSAADIAAAQARTALQLYTSDDIMRAAEQVRDEEGAP